MRDRTTMGEMNSASVTVQAVVFSILSTTIAQCFAAWQDKQVIFRLLPYLKFILLAVITTPPNYFYQKWLEDTFPSQVLDSASQTSTSAGERTGSRLSKKNVAIKFFLDQTFGASVNTMAYVALMGLSKGYGLEQVVSEINAEFWPLLMAGWRVWPFVTLLNLCVVPWEWRPAVGNTAGLCWGTYLTVTGL